MSGLHTPCKHFKTADAEIGSSFDPSAIPFIPKASTLKIGNSQESNLCIPTTKKDKTYKFKAHIFSNGSPKDILEWEKKMMRIVKYKPVDTAEGKFDLVEVILEGDALTHWLKFKGVEVACMSKNPDSLDTVLLGMCNPTFAICPQELKKHYFPKNASHLQKAYLCNYIRKLH
eukprot:15357574-Ditylum_brightwellii.AAC.1